MHIYGRGKVTRSKLEVTIMTSMAEAGDLRIR